MKTERKNVEPTSQSMRTQSEKAMNMWFQWDDILGKAKLKR